MIIKIIAIELDGEDKRTKVEMGGDYVYLREGDAIVVEKSSSVALVVDADAWPVRSEAIT